MISISDLINAVSLLGKLSAKRLSKEEKEFLIRAEANRGEIHVLEPDLPGLLVRIGIFAYLDDEDPAVRVKGLETLRNLIRKGLIVHESGVLFCLTGSGFDKARKLKKVSWVVRFRPQAPHCPHRKD